MIAFGISLIAAVGSSAPEGRSDPQAVWLMHKFATCVVRGQRKEVRAALLLPVGSADSIEALQYFARRRSGCLPINGRLRMSEPLLRVAMAEVAYRDEFKDASGETTDLARPFVGSGNPDLFGQDVAACVALRDPGGAHGVVHSKAASSAEKAAFQNVGPAISGCVPAGVKARFERRQLRGLLAQALYQARHVRAASKSSHRAIN